MAGLYLDTSSLGRVLLAEPDANQIREILGRYEASWSSAILTIELRRLARREHLETAADQFLASVRLTPITDATIQRASRLEPVQVRTLDAIHLDAAIELHRAGTITSVPRTTSSSSTGAATTAYPYTHPADRGCRVDGADELIAGTRGTDVVDGDHVIPSVVDRAFAVAAGTPRFLGESGRPPPSGSGQSHERFVAKAIASRPRSARSERPSARKRADAEGRLLARHCLSAWEPLRTLGHEGDACVLCEFLHKFESSSEDEGERRRHNVEIPRSNAVAEQQPGVCVIELTGPPLDAVGLYRGVVEDLPPRGERGVLARFAVDENGATDAHPVKPVAVKTDELQVALWRKSRQDDGFEARHPHALDRSANRNVVEHGLRDGTSRLVCAV
jgi:hypothetical protein